MRRPVLALLLGLVFAPFPLHAQSVTLNICNTGTVDLDAIFSGGGPVLDSTIRPGTCAAVAKSEGGGMAPAYLGLAFTDSRGQYGAARRFASPNTLTLDGSRTVQRRNVSVPLQLLFQARFPVCEKVPTGTSAVFGNTTIVEVTNVCEDLGYTMLVETHPDSHEVSLEYESISGALSLNNRRVTFSEKPEIDWAGEEAKRKAHEMPVPVKWSDLLSTLRNRSYQGKLHDVLPGYFVVRGTVAAVELTQQAVGPKTYITVAQINFRESPAVPHWRPDTRPIPEFNVCTERLDILQEQFSANFRTGMIGKTIEVHGDPFAFGERCYGQRASFQIYLGRQIHPVPSAVFAADARVWVPPPVVVPPPRRAPTSAEIEADIVSRANYATSEVEFRAKARMNAACAERTDKALNANPGNRDAIVKEYSACQAAANAEAARERQKAQACAQQVIRADPANPDGTSRDPEGLQRALRACTQAAASGPTPGPAPVAAPAQPALVTPFGPAPQTPNLMVACQTRMKRDYPDAGKSNPDAYSKAYLACLQGQ
jgi:hypothetical protein